MTDTDGLLFPLEPFQGELVAIGIAAEAKAPIQIVPRAEVTLGVGIVGDRYTLGKGAGQRGRAPQAEQQVSLIAEEAIAAACKASGLAITHPLTRRNLLVRGVPLNDLVRQTFFVGEVALRGLELCDPCGYLEKQTFPFIKQALKKRGGLRTAVLRGGTIQPGDIVRLATQEEKLALLSERP
jgi:MOSC domain-containing protein YiiM